MLEKLKSGLLAVLGVISGILLVLFTRSKQKEAELESAVKSAKLDKEIERDLENGRKALDEYTGSRLSYDEWKRKYRPKPPTS